MSQMNGKYPNPEVKIVQRRFSGEYKRRILKEAGQCRYGELGALLRTGSLSLLKGCLTERTVASTALRRLRPLAFAWRRFS